MKTETLEIRQHRFQYGKFGLSENPIGQYVALTLSGRQYLGNVVAVRYESTRGMTILTVRHFNGELWPIEPVASAVEVLR